MLRSLQLSKQLAIHIHALSSFENAMQRFDFPVQARSLTSLIPGNEFHCVRQFTAEDVETFLKITGDANLIHTNSAAAIAAGLQAPILPGIMLASLFPAIIGTNFPGAIYLSQTLKFRQPATVESWVRATVRLEKLSGSRASFATECVLLPTPTPNKDKVGTPQDESTTTVLLEGQALALLKDINS
ncbi:putative 3-hydroxybutyryl-CoA dehydratase [Nannochloris sp. 'desiccata']|nr:putative 3-hydroxybutyryl-CoA dehydratase [Chlorella desiccata (nom. nud.)]